MFGRHSKDQIVKGIKDGAEFFVPLAEFGKGAIDSIANRGKVSSPVNMWDILSVAKRRFCKMNPIAPNQADLVNWILYDRISFAQNTTIPALVKLFVAPIGQGGKTKVDTNLEAVSQLTNPEWMNVTGLGFFFANGAAGPDIDAFFATEYMEFWVGSSKVYLEGPVQCFPSGAGRFGGTTLGTMSAAASSFAVNQGSGWPVISNLYDVRLPGGLNLGLDSNGNAIVADGLIGITILQSQTFNVQLKADGGGATLLATAAVPVPGVGLTVGCYLHGIKSRGVY